MSECYTLTSLVSTVKMRIIVVVSGSILKEYYRLLVKHLCISLIPLHVFEECNVIFDLAFSVSNIVRLSDVW